MPECLICQTSYEPSEFPFGAAGEEPCACGTCASADTVREMGADWFVRKCADWSQQKLEGAWTVWDDHHGEYSAEDEADDRADHAIDEQGNER